MVLSANTDTQVGNSNASGQNIFILLCIAGVKLIHCN